MARVDALRWHCRALRGHFQPPQALARLISRRVRVNVPLGRAWLPGRRPFEGHSLVVCRPIPRLSGVKMPCGRVFSGLARGYLAAR